MRIGRAGWFGALCGVASGLSGCATTGLAWVNEPESGVDLTPPSETGKAELHGERHMVSRPAAESFAEPRRDARHRLDHTVTLGEVETFDARPPAAAPYWQSPTVVNVYVTPSMTPGYLGAYGPAYGFGAPFFTSARTVGPVATSSVTMRPGLDWPAVPNHGPSFPYRTAPAPAFEGERTRQR